MKPFRVEKGIVAPLMISNIDTDQIIPKQFLKRIERTGYGEFLFYDWRYRDDGSENPEFVLNQEPYRKARFLLTEENFGCGSSREHAPWALADFGFRAILAPSFADIFYNNCFKNGLLPIVLPTEIIQTLYQETQQNIPYELTIDLPRQVIIKPDEEEISFEIDAFRKENLIEGCDDIGITLQFEDKISEFEKQHRLFISVPDND